MFLKTVLILRIFTSHYVSINSIFTLTKVRPPMAFTSHYVSINSSRRNASIFELANLHPTMYLLIPSKTAILIIIVQRFTSHYVSINSGNRLKYCRKVLEFTSHYVSINSFYSITSAELSSTFTSHYVSINSIPTLPVINMSDTFTSHYVSINSSDTEPSNAFQLIFTSHYVSINSIQQPQSVGQLLQDLHPTMYLLILFLFTIHCYIQLHLHPTMYLLILTLQRQGIQVSVFTSHYVSINSVCLLKLYYLLL